MKVVVEYDKYNTKIVKANIPVDEGSYQLALTEGKDKVQLQLVDELGTPELNSTLEMKEEDIIALSRLLSQIARGIELTIEE